MLCPCLSSTCSPLPQPLQSAVDNLHYLYHRLKQPEYQCYREKLGAAKSVEAVEQICLELKSLLQVGMNIVSFPGRNSPPASPPPPKEWPGMYCSRMREQIAKCLEKG